MSELKVHRFLGRHEVNQYDSDPFIGNDYYLKSEADKVIAEKDAVIADLIEKNKRLANKDMIMASETIKGLFDALRHNKYKRCLAMAQLCFEKSPKTALVKYDKKSGLFRNFYDWWGYRWLELAEKFKEVK